MTRAALLLVALMLDTAGSAQNYEGTEHDSLFYLPQQETPTDYTNGAVRLGNIPGQDLVSSLGGSGLPLGQFKPSQPANSTTNAARPPVNHLRASRQSVGLDRNPDTGLPLDTFSTRSRGFGDVEQTPSERERSEAAALSASDPR